MTWHSFYKLRGRLLNSSGTGSAGPAAGLAYSDWFFMAAIVTGIIGSSTFVSGLLVAGSPAGSMITGFATLLTTIFAALGKYLQSKGD